MERKHKSRGPGRLILPLWATALLVSLAMILAGCDTTDRMSTFDAEGPVSLLQLNVFYVTLWVSLGIFVVVGSLLVFTIFRFRAPLDLPRDAELPPQTHGNAALEITLTVISVALLIVIAVPTVQGIFKTNIMPVSEDAVVVNVTGYQWWWLFEYPKEKVRTSNELVIPIGKPVILNLRTADVIHSFWVPKLAGKVDLIPGQYNQLWMQADRGGWYYGQCAEFCGESHANMRFRVQAVYDQDFKQWANRQRQTQVAPAGGLALEGYNTFMKGPKVGQSCSSCHTIKGTPANGVLGPDLTHFASRQTLGAGMLPRNDQTIHEWLTDLNGVKPGNKMLDAHLDLTDREVDALTAYLDTLN